MKKPDKKRIGILGGISYESTIKYYSIIHSEYYSKFYNYDFPEVIIFSLNFGKVIDLEHNKDDKTSYINYLHKGIQALERAGAQVILMAANSVHSIYNELKDLANIPILSIVHVTGNKARKLGLKKVLLLGIKLTMQSNFYQNYFKEIEIDLITPSLEEQNRIDNIIFQELVRGDFKEESKSEILGIIHNYDVDGVILGCTELPLIIYSEDLEIRVLNTLKLHALAGLNFSLRSE
ncbi:MAG: amino acid racemase [Promethearchaeota archaeon]|nr:MAG: amino acid racemase [Candidatus Lokiarchaeota archaeon]